MNHDREELPEYRENPLIAKLPLLLSPADAWRALADPPHFDASERQLPAHIRAHCIQRLGRYFEPLERHLQLEASFAALLRQGYLSRNIRTQDYIRRLQDGHERVVQKDMLAFRHPVRSTASSFALIGCSGVGKSKGIERVLELYPQVIHHDEPFSLDQVVWVKLDCPYVGSPKQLCISFFKEIDRLLGTRYLGKHGARRISIDEMMVHMAHVSNLHAVGVLVIDEIQHLNQARGTGPDAMLNFLVTLVNTIGIPVIIIGTLGALPLLQGDFRQARRASGLGSLVWERMEDGPAWRHFIEKMWTYQWTREVAPLTEEIRCVLYEESQGILDIVVKLFMLTQLRALQLGAMRGRPEIVDVGLLKHVAKESFRVVYPMIDALKRNDRQAIAKYHDIRPLQDHVMQAFSDATARLTPSVPVHVAPVGKVTNSAENDTDPLLRALEGIGIAPDVAAILLAEARASNPGLGPLDLIACIAEKLHARGSEAKPAKPRRRPKVKPDVGPGDLPALTIEGKEKGLSAYEALRNAGWIKPMPNEFLH
ncbi:ATP-binding protein [Rhodomicrobium sp. Az07]|uniref:ATP-binding protein n=1 Tax=Rhodomicrobium sp. Az07 TaxID=2839034 RepID=UPI001BE92AB3|nr:ATP-binding protein [Rhodomicrobium sp. Az07]MBT3069571.1 ATP-binding protein [Rhodomicrobium sp. Az07]